MTLPSPSAEALSYANWELTWAPYDQATYDQALGFLRPQDIVIEIGAGDLRLACQMAARVRRVTAIEIDQAALALAPARLPPNLVVQRGDARTLEYSPASVGVLMMRHCTHFRLYYERLRAAGCNRMITNARWRMSVEQINFEVPRLSYSRLPLGWYACSCGAVGFKPAEPEKINLDNVSTCTEVSACPACAGRD